MVSVKKKTNQRIFFMYFCILIFEKKRHFEVDNAKIYCFLLFFLMETILYHLDAHIALLISYMVTTIIPKCPLWLKNNEWNFRHMCKLHGCNHSISKIIIFQPHSIISIPFNSNSTLCCYNTILSVILLY